MHFFLLWILSFFLVSVFSVPSCLDVFPIFLLSSSWPSLRLSLTSSIQYMGAPILPPIHAQSLSFHSFSPSFLASFMSLSFQTFVLTLFPFHLYFFLSVLSHSSYPIFPSSLPFFFLPCLLPSLCHAFQSLFSFRFSLLNPAWFSGEPFNNRVWKSVKHRRETVQAERVAATLWINEALTLLNTTDQTFQSEPRKKKT